MGSPRSVYVAKKATALTNPVTAYKIFLSSDNSANAAFVGIPAAASVGVSGIDGVAFQVTANGKIHVPTTSSTCLIALYFTTSARLATTYNATGNSSTCGITCASMTAAYDGQFYLQATFLWDYTSKILNGWYTAFGGPTPTLTSPAVTTQVTAVDLSAPKAGFVFGTYLGSSGSDTTVTLQNFTLEVL